MGGQGASLFISDVRTEAGEVAVAHWRSRGIAAQFMQADLTDLSDIRALFRRVTEDSGAIDVLVTCAGIASLAKDPDITPEEWDKVFAVNLKVTFFCCQEALRYMVARKRGKIVTAMTGAWVDDINTAFAQKIPFKRYGTPEEIGQTIAFLASDQASYLTGETIDVNGGLVMD